MTDREVIETIEGCTAGCGYCVECSIQDYGGGSIDACMGYLLEQALDIIQRQEELINATTIGQETLQMYFADNGLILPCRIGDSVWCIRHYRNGIRHIQKGIVHEMFFTSDMELCISVKHIARGKWGETIFPTRESAEQALKGGVQE